MSVPAGFFSLGDKSIVLSFDRYFLFEIMSSCRPKFVHMVLKETSENQRQSKYHQIIETLVQIRGQISASKNVN